VDLSVTMHRSLTASKNGEGLQEWNKARAHDAIQRQNPRGGSKDRISL
jgi:hypothetical protein